MQDPLSYSRQQINVCPGLLKNTCQFSETFCRVARYAESYSSKVEMLAVLPITISILMLTLRGLTSCTTQIMIMLCSVVWIVPALYLGSFSLLGVLKPGTFGIVFTNDSRRCDFAGDEYQNYVLGESIIFFYLPVLACVILYTVVGFYLVRYQVLGVARLARRGLWITFFYCLCWIPFMVVLTLVEHGHKNRTLLLYTYLFFYSSVIINPLVYVFTSKPFQVIMKRLMTPSPRIQRFRDPKLVHVNDQGSFEVGRGAGNLVETTSEAAGIVSMVEEISDAEMIEG